jgi:hypothetical protein
MLPEKVNQNLELQKKYIYIRLKIKPNSVRIRFYSCQIFVLPSEKSNPRGDERTEETV